MNKKLHIGTSGWQYKHWYGTFYPETIKKKDHFSYYLERFDSVELNNPFYGIPKPHYYTKWREQVPKGFTYTIKVNRLITHMKKLKNAVDSANRFINDALLLEDKLGALLFQLPPKINPEPEVLDDFLAGLEPKGLHCAFEFRDRRWLNGDFYKVLEKHKAAYVIYEIDYFLSPEVITSDVVYLRLHGPLSKYSGSYSDETLRMWSDKIKGWLEARKTVYAYFDNDQNGYAPHNALRLKEFIQS